MPMIQAHDAAQLAEAALAVAQTNPKRAEALALAALRVSSSARVVAIAERARGLAARERYDLRDAVVHQRRAARVAEAAGLTRLAAEARMSLSLDLALAGRGPEARIVIARAIDSLNGPARTRALVQRGAVSQVLGDLDEALDAYRIAVPRLRRSADTASLADLLHNRGSIFVQRHNLGAGERDLLEAERLYVSIGQQAIALDTRQHLAMVAMLRGDLPGALQRFDENDEYLRSQGRVDPIGLRDHAEILLGARLLTEARAVAGRAVEELARRGLRAALAEARCYEAEAALLAGEAAVAAEAAHRAALAFSRQKRVAWGARSRAIEVRALWALNGASTRLLRRACAAASSLELAGSPAAALDAYVLAAGIAMEVGRTGEATQYLARAAIARRRGPVGIRARAWHAEALLRTARGDIHGARAAVRAGLDMLDAHHIVLGATELRAHASAYGAELAALGLAIELERGRPEAVLRATERWRARALRAPETRPPRDKRLAGDLEELRLVARDVEHTVQSGGDGTVLLARQAALERSIQRRARHARATTAPTLRASVKQVVADLDDSVLVEMCVDGDVLHAVVAVNGRMSLHALGSAAQARYEGAALRFAIRRLASSRTRSNSREAFMDAARRAAIAIDEQVLAPLRGSLDDRPIVLVPGADLHAVPWAALPSMAGCALSVAPSAQLWARAKRATNGGHYVLVAGPGLPGAAREVATLGRRYGDATRLTSNTATVANVCAALDGAAVAHIAAHGRFRADNPHFSSLQMADGPITVYDIERISRPPRVVVLSACESGLSATDAGDELMGLAASLLALGTRALVASVAPVPDDATRQLMLIFHQNLRRGTPPAAALANAQDAMRRRGASIEEYAGFVCFGAG